jgi:uncharacterized SAM-binding protein YcdF (DUF218 family)
MALLGAALLPVALERWLIIADDPREADAALVLNYADSRALHAAELFRDGWIHQVVAAHATPEATTRLREVLRGAGVPDSAILVLPHSPGVNSTMEEARVAAGWARQQGARRLIVVTDPWYTRRARYALRTAGGGDLEVLMSSPPDLGLPWRELPLEYWPLRWWQGLRRGQRELTKLVGYVVLYGPVGSALGGE